MSYSVERFTATSRPEGPMVFTGRSKRLLRHIEAGTYKTGSLTIDPVTCTQNGHIQPKLQVQMSQELILKGRVKRECVYVYMHMDITT